MRAGSLWLVLAACGRVGFDPNAGDGGAAPDAALAGFLHVEGDTGTQAAVGIALAPDGSLGVVGLFENSLDVGTTLTTRGALDSFIAQFSPDGTPRWAFQIGGTGDDQVRGIAIDAQGNSYVVGHFEADVDCGGGVLTAAGEHDIFVASYGPDGAFRWQRRYGGNATGSSFGSDLGFAITASPSGDVYVGGQFTGTVDFGSGFTLNSVTSNFAGFVLALDTSGSTRWARPVGATASTANKVSGIAADDAGVVATGYFQGTTSVGGSAISSNGAHDIFIASWTRDSAHRWSTSRGGPDIDWGHTIAINSRGDVIVAGSYQTMVDFGGGVVGTSTAQASGYLMVFDAVGGQRWSKVLAGACTRVLAAAIGPADHVFLAGDFNGSLTDGNTTVTSAGPGDGFVLEYDVDGVIRRSGSTGGTGFDGARDIAPSASGGYYAVGEIGGADYCPSYAANLGGEDDLFLSYTPP